MSQRTSNLINAFDYVSLDSAIDQLIALREEHGGHSVLDIGLETAPYEDTPHVVITVLIKE